MLRFFRFSLVGGMGFIIDSLCFWFFKQLLHDIMLARLFSFWCAALTTWIGNRLLTFKTTIDSKREQLIRHLIAVHFAGVANLISFWFISQLTHITIAFTAGVGVGMMVNFLLATHFVFVSKDAANVSLQRELLPQPDHLQQSRLPVHPK